MKIAIRFLDELRGDLGYAARRLRAAPGVTALAVLILALGIGTTTAMYSLGEPLLDPPLRAPQPHHLAMLWQREANYYWPTVSPANFLDWQRQGKALAALAAFQFSSPMLHLEGEAPVARPAINIGPGFFHALGVRPQMGRGFTAQEFQPGPARAVILTRYYWQHRLHGQGGLVGKTIKLDGHRATIVGITAVNFPIKDGIFVPLRFTPAEWRERSRSATVVYALARRRAGVSPAAELAGFAAIAARLARQHPRADKDLRAGLVTPGMFINGNLTPVFVHLLLIGAGLLLVLAAANVANLELALALRRTREMALRTALGAGRGRLLRQLLAESLLLALLGGAAGVGYAAWRVYSLQHQMPGYLGHQILGWDDLAVNRPALLFALGLALASGLLAGLAPAWLAARTNLMGVMKEGGYSVSPGKHRLRRLLIVLQMGLAFALLAGAAVSVNGLKAMLDRTHAFHGNRRLVFALHLPLERYPQPQQRLQFAQRLLPRLRALPGVKAAALSLSLPWANGDSPMRYLNLGRPEELARGQHPLTVMAQPISPNYFRLLRLPLLAGRSFRAQDGAGAPPVAIVSRGLARRLWPGQNPLGRTIEEPGKPAERLRVVGIAPDLHYNLFNPEPEKVLYWPYAQTLAAASLLPANQLSALSFSLKTGVPPETLAGAVRRAVAATDPELATSYVWSLNYFFSLERTPLAMADAAMLSTGNQALLIALIGLYAVIATLAAERRREIGIRMVLGAQAGQVRWLSLRQGLRLTLGGILLSLPLAWLANRYLAHFMYGVRPGEYGLLAGVGALLALAALAASYWPARQAARLDPMQVLRTE